ncbi:ATP-grasp domain-containing protein [Methanobacterium movens]
MKILFIGARLFDEVAFYAREMGVETILSESSPESTNLKLADKYFLVPRGMDHPMEIALKEDVDAVVPLIGIDKPLLEVARMKEILEKEYNLPVVASGVDATQIAGDKLKTKQFLTKNNIKTPEFQEISREQYLQNNHSKIENNKFKFPSVLKQAEGQGGMGIKIALSKNDADSYFEQYDTAIAEKFVKGMEVSVEVLSWKGKTIALVPVYKGETTLDCTHPLNKMRTAPAQIPQLDNEKLRKLSEDIVDKMGGSGTIEVEFIFDPITCELNALEVNTRPSGTRYLTLTSSSVHPLHELVNMGISKWNKEQIEKNMESNSALEMRLPENRKKAINEIFEKYPENYLNKNLFAKNRPWIIHGHEKARRITIRAKDNNETINIAKKLKIME